VVIVVDTLRRDHVGIHGYERDTTPSLDAFSEEAVVFENAVSTSPWTLPSFGSILTSRLPAYHGAAGSGDQFYPLDSSVTTIQEALSRIGYATAAFTNSPFLNSQFGLDNGFDVYDHYDGNNHDMRRADEMTTIALDWIQANADDKFFVLVHYFDPHLDYDPPPDFALAFMPESALPKPFRVSPADLKMIRSRRTTLTQARMDTIIALYDAEILYTDSAIGRLLNGLREMDLFETTAIVITSDHGEEFWDHNGFEHGHTLYGELINVPLLLRLPDASGRRTRIEERVSLIDVAPTLLDYLGFESPSGFHGQSLLERINGGPHLDRSVCSEALLFGQEKKAITQFDYKYILSVTGQRELYNLQDDPGELLNIAGGNSSLSQLLQESLFEVFGSPTETSAPREPALSLEAETLEQLKALGYIR
jgi:arylsulfatase A-like enzyme